MVEDVKFDQVFMAKNQKTQRFLGIETGGFRGSRNEALQIFK